ncbi:hypothetical protein [Sphingobium nicotianae]|uniref:Uncharacterized protein n=1 Tax=Sphingobium nicotianae TaxID=2782607 RepID=A0A9X1DAK3_9SPHN|nr:hypothetical protein [Sphingobium nicotianae]MBT2186409.1 hypothetical protein [Sphingobium nicotianae]
MWLLTIAFALTGLSLWVGGGFVGAREVAKGCGFLAMLACPFLWARPTGLVPDEIAIGGKRRLMIGLALIAAAPLLLPWQLWI